MKSYVQFDHTYAVQGGSYSTFESVHEILLYNVQI